MTEPIQSNESAGLKRFWKEFLDEPMPQGVGWSHVFGSILLLLVAVQFFTGILLALYYSPSPSSAYQSIQYIDNQAVSGKLIRGLHHWSASAFVIVLAMHLMRTFLYAAYKKPRRGTWIAGVALLLIVLGFAFTGYLFPWDMKAYFATRVGIEVGASAPLLGPIVAKLLKGGSEMGELTLSRFYAIHVIVLPLALLFLVAIHLFFIRIHKITPPWKKEGEPASYPNTFYPFQMAKDTVAVAVAFAAILFVAAKFGPPLEAPADPTNTNYVPRPDWYFYGLYQLLRIFQGPLEVIGTVVLPTAFFLSLFALPFLDKNPERALRQRPYAVISGLVTLSIIVIFTVWGGLEGAREVAAARQRQAAQATTTTPAVEKADPESGRKLFADLRCGECHHSVSQGINIPPGLEFAGSKFQKEWLAEYLQKPYRMRWSNVNVRPVIRMPDFDLSSDEAQALATALMQQVDTVKIAPTGIAWEKQDTDEVADGRKLVNDYACLGCHKINGEGTQLGPDLSRVGRKLKPDYMYRMILKPKSVIPGTPMKDNELWEDEATAIVRYLMTLQ